MHKLGQRWLDAAAVGASAACLLHCLAVPTLITALPLVVGVLDANETVHRVLLAFALPASVLALTLGHRRHQHLAPPVGGALGLALLGLALFFDRSEMETAMTVAGSILLASAHVMNWRLDLRQV